MGYLGILRDIKEFLGNLKDYKNFLGIFGILRDPDRF